ncbi:testis-expressed protein 264-like [Gigantopelta aegis]|uniref:testis-expressed protein 264-like n=1 Tax=Gigantopelta aegis TaxID=1735272 RepID=UPI001B888F9E|nr:testis-expressed protein 264-like [Gigantopelta aegis]
MEETGLIFVGIIGLLLCLLITIFILVVYSGLFLTPEVGAGHPHFGEIVVAYKFCRGSYKEAGPLFTEVAIIAPDNKAIGIYYDDPQLVKADDLRYIVGSILSEDNSEIDEDLKKKFLDKDFKLHTLPLVTNVVKTTFPYISLLSIFIAIYKVYPRIGAYVEEHKLCAHPIVEMYDGKNINFMAPLAKQDEFYVPECAASTAEKIQDLETSLDESTIKDTSLSGGDQSLESSFLESSVTPDRMTVGDSADVLTDPVMADPVIPAVEETKLGEFATATEVTSLDLTSQGKKETESGSEASTTSSFEDIKMETEDLTHEETKKEQ